MYQSIRECNRHTSYVTLASVKPSLFSYIHLRAIINVCFQNNEPDSDRDVKVSPQNVTLRLRPGTIPHTVDKVVTLRANWFFGSLLKYFCITDNNRFHIMIHCWIQQLLNPTLFEDVWNVVAQHMQHFRYNRRTRGSSPLMQILRERSQRCWIWKINVKNIIVYAGRLRKYWVMLSTIFDNSQTFSNFVLDEVAPICNLRRPPSL